MTRRAATTPEAVAEFYMAHLRYRDALRATDDAFGRWFRGEGRTRPCDVTRLDNIANEASRVAYCAWDDAYRSLDSRHDPFDVLGIPHDERYY